MKAYNCVVDIFLEIVQIDSESGHEQLISEFVQDFLGNLNVEFSVDKRNQIYAKILGKGELKNEALLFCAHMDTVSPGKNIIPEILEDGKIISKNNTILGADNKASLAVMLWNILEFSKSRENLTNFHTMEFFFTVCEEVDNPGVKDFDASKISAKIGFIWDKANESDLNYVVMKASYLDDVILEFLGKASHASFPEQGINTLDMLGEFLSQIKLGIPYPESTLNLGTINGGSTSNTVPAAIKLTGDYRATNLETMQKIAEDLKNARDFVLSQAKFKEAKIDLEIIEYCLGFELDSETESFQRLEKIYQNFGYKKLNQIETQSASDGNYLNNLENLTVYNLNDGCFKIHSKEEYTTTQSLEKLAKIMREIVFKF